MTQEGSVLAPGRLLFLFWARDSVRFVSLMRSSCLLPGLW